MKPKRRNKQKDILFILISSFVVVVAWIGFNLYDIWATSSVSLDVQAQLTPIDAVFDPQTIQGLRSRENVNPLFESQGTAIASAPAKIQQSAPTSTTQTKPSNTPINRQGQ
jgi:hypothetical protein